jgi:adenine nucleotide transporter 17
MSPLKDVAPAPTEGELESSSASSGPVNTIAPRDPTPTTSAAQQSDNIAHALAGAGGGLIAMALTYPLITLSTRAQVESKRADTSTLDAVRNIIKREGITGLYAGLDSALFGISVTNFVYYYWYEWTRSFFEKAAVKAGRASKKLTTIESMLAGALAGSATVLITNPIWVVNTRMTARKNETDGSDLPGGEKKVHKKPSTVGTLLSLLKNEGPSSLFAGVLPALVLVINPILQYTFFEQLKNFLEKSKRVGPRDAFVLGALGKLLATTITYPYITVKSRAHVATKDAPVEGMSKSLKKIVREEGWQGLYKGIVPKVSQSVLTAAFLFAFKDVLYDAMIAARRRAKAVKV